MAIDVEAEMPELDEYVDEIVEAFEAEFARQGRVEIEQFIPQPNHPFYLAVLRELVRVDLDLSWERGQGKRLESYLQKFPELFEDAICLQEIAFEEYRLRRQAGEDAAAAEEYSTRFHIVTSDWPRVECAIRRDYSEAPTGAAAVKKLGFRLVAELGKGAFGNVYLANQGELADRLVVLKVSNDVTTESHSLAQLQHTNIVPIHSVHRSGEFEAVCMPYLGRTTLADALQELSSRSQLPVSGRDLLSTLRQRRSETVVMPASHAPATAGTNNQPAANSHDTDADLPVIGVSEPLLEMIQELTFVETVLWIVARLADGLAHAHERGILHRDLKPANVLLTDDGQPMLLDFSLSSDLKRRTSNSAAYVGGTLPYMSPEHLDALQGMGSDRAIDARSDIFSLGVILYELLTLRHPFSLRHGSFETVLPEMVADRRHDTRDVRPWNEAVTPAVESIVQKCLEPNPSERYQTARQLQEDLDRQLHDLPLKFAPDRSTRERARKWFRRHPRLSSSTSVAALALLVIVSLFGWSILRGQQLARLEAMQSWNSFRDDLREVQYLLGHPSADRSRREKGIALGHRALARYDVETNAGWVESHLVRRLPNADRSRLRGEAADLLFLLAGATAEQTAAVVGTTEFHDVIQSALTLNMLSETCYDAERLPRAFWVQRAKLQHMLGNTTAASTAEREAAQVPLRSANDFYLLGSQHLKQREFREALALLKEANRQAPHNLAIWMELGNCHASLSQFTEAAGCYSACLALWSESQWPYFYRGLAHFDLSEYELACADFSQAIELCADHVESRINRGLSRLALGDVMGAIEDYTHAIEHDSTYLRVYFMRAQARELAGDVDGAARDRQEGLRREPACELDWISRGVAQLAGDPASALADFEHALAINPHSLEGMQNTAHVLSESLGRVEEAIAVLDQAIRCYPDFVPARAGRGVLLARCGKREAALRDAEQVLARDSKPETLYQVAGIYALTSPQEPADRMEALRLLSSALRQEPRWLEIVATDSDLDNIRNDTDFQRLIGLFAQLTNNAPRATHP